MEPLTGVPTSENNPSRSGFSVSDGLDLEGASSFIVLLAVFTFAASFRSRSFFFWMISLLKLSQAINRTSFSAAFSLLNSLRKCLRSFSRQTSLL